MRLGLGLGFGAATLLGGGGGGPWTPLDLGAKLAAWWDPSDALSYTLVSGKYSQLNDKSGNGMHATQTASTNRLSQGSGINGLNTLVLGNTKYLDVGDFSALTEAEVFRVRKLPADPPATQIADLYLGNADCNTPYSDGKVYDGFASTALHISSGAITFGTNAHVYGCISTATEWSIYVDFVQQYTTGTNTVGFDAAGAIGIGKATIASDAAEIGDIILCNQKLTAPERANVRAYLAAKWGTP